VAAGATLTVAVAIWFQYAITSLPGVIAIVRLPTGGRRRALRNSVGSNGVARHHQQAARTKAAPRRR
jgi:hypothetical protein